MKRVMRYIIPLSVLAVVTAAFFTFTPQDRSDLLREYPGFESSVGSREDPAARARYEWMRLRDPVSGEIPEGIRERELTYARTLPAKEERLLKGSGVAEWAQYGPYNVGGRTRALALDVSDETANTILAGGVSGGMWRSTDGGSTWTKTTQATQLHSVTCIAQDTRTGNRSTWYYGTGEYKGNSASGENAYYNGDGIFKSTDNGLTWNQLSTTASGTPQTFESNFDYIWNIKVDPTNGNVYAATYGAIYKSTDG